MRHKFWTEDDLLHNCLQPQGFILRQVNLAILHPSHYIKAMNDYEALFF
jgi:hypothetical protein